MVTVQSLHHSETHSMGNLLLIQPVDQTLVLLHDFHIDHGRHHCPVHSQVDVASLLRWINQLGLPLVVVNLAIGTVEAALLALDRIAPVSDRTTPVDLLTRVDQEIRGSRLSATLAFPFPSHLVGSKRGSVSASTTRPFGAT